MTVELFCGDCIPKMADLIGPYDMILADLPYGTTACKWDTVIPFKPLWEQYKRLIKRKGAVVLFGSQPFTSALVMSNAKWFKYTLVWNKRLNSNPLNAPYRPLSVHEDLCVFSPAASTYSPQGTMTYNPQMSEGKPYRKTKKPGKRKQIFRTPIEPSKGINESGKRYPLSVIEIHNAFQAGKVHPTQKPVALLEYLIRTYTNEGETVVDNTMGSGSTGVACVNTGRSFVGIEMDAGYFEIAETRIEKAQAEMVQAEMAL